MKILKDMGFKMRAYNEIFYRNNYSTQETWTCEELLGGALL